ncbi:hypothetical protein ENSA5_25600 [Enhygromyxa salina]|uniref:Tetratricopeptide repeat protein n=1 Tax=Enhygromyxa salina TaxID=215803 RepID=A0A2S9YAU4_9BACT|nr:hypothetical protein [Enhygromyxa salina]PRQ02225.1 hypothetical protein ENSA5_25600 [Enhygromyxa salina]
MNETQAPKGEGEAREPGRRLEPGDDQARELDLDLDLDHGLASPTLAQLYLAQGHPGRARTICREVLADDPTNGYALALLERLRRASAARLEARLEARFVPSSEAGIELGAGELELSWSVPRGLLAEYDDARVDVVLAIAAPRATLVPQPTTLRYTSLRCLDLQATARREAPLGPASAAAILVLSPGPQRKPTLLSPRPRRPGLRVLAVAESLSW